MIGPIHNMRDFEWEVAKMRAEGWTDSDYMARQLVDDHYRHTGDSLHGVQGAVQLLVIGMPVTFVLQLLLKLVSETEVAPEIRSGTEALLRLVEAT